MTTCRPSTRPGATAKMLCAVHCYGGTVDERVRALEAENEKLRSVIREQQSRIFALGDQNFWLKQGKPVGFAENGHLQMKIQRQRAALMQLQKKRGAWDPEIIIFEHEPAPDLVIEEDAA